MSYQALARKWRPSHFEHMVGQEHILRMLSNALTQKRIHHAYLFTGTRGVGKTTLARILAKCLSCSSGITSTPCGSCFACHGIDQGNFIDLYEIDAASRTKVEDTRDLLENILYPPNQGRFKIYLIDEVHMLSNHSFNALLKTLEEPPEHVKFLLATTDPKRLPITILSRCLQFHLKPISKEKISRQLEYICTQETIESDSFALNKLAQAADGSMRDALSLLDQAIAFGRGKVHQADVEMMLGCVAQEDLFPLLTALAEKNGKEMINCIQTLREQSLDFHHIFEELISIFHQIAILQIIPDAFQVDERITNLAQLITAEDAQLYYQIALLSRRDLSLSPSPCQGFEMSMLRMLAFKTDHEDNTHSTQKKNVTEIKKSVATVQRANKLQVEVENKKVVTTDKSLLELTTWREILPKLELSGMAYALASNCNLGKISENSVELILSESHHPMLNAKLKERIQEAICRYTKKALQVNIQITNQEIHTPHIQAEEEKKQQLSLAKDMILQNSNVKKMVEIFDASVDVSLQN